MNKKNWTSPLLILLGINVVAVACSSAWHLAHASDPIQNFEEASSNSVVENGSEEPTLNKPVQQDGPAATANSQRSEDLQENAPQEAKPVTIAKTHLAATQLPPLSQGTTDSDEEQPHSVAKPIAQTQAETADENAIDLEGLSNIPSLSTDLEKDPIFQEIQSMFGNSSSPKKPNDSEADLNSDRFYASLENRMETASLLSSAAHGLACEAVSLKTAGEHAKAQKILAMLAKIREITAELIVSEL